MFCRCLLLYIGSADIDFRDRCDQPVFGSRPRGWISAQVTYLIDRSVAWGAWKREIWTCAAFGWLQKLHFFFWHINGRKTEVLGTLYAITGLHFVKTTKFDWEIVLCLILKNSTYAVHLPLKHRSSSCDFPSWMVPKKFVLLTVLTRIRGRPSK